MVIWMPVKTQEKTWKRQDTSDTFRNTQKDENDEIMGISRVPLENDTYDSFSPG